MTEQNKGIQVLDPAAIQRLREMVGEDDAFLVELIDTFLQDAPRLLADMHRTAEQEDAAELRLAAHSLKSNSADFGALALSGMCQELEEMGKVGALDGAAEIVTRSEEEYKQVKTALEATRRKLSNQDE